MRICRLFGVLAFGFLAVACSVSGRSITPLAASAPGGRLLPASRPAEALYVANAATGNGDGWVSEYATGSFKFLRKIRNGTIGAHALAIDPAGRLFVAGADSVTIYPRGARSPIHTITGTDKHGSPWIPGALAIDAADNLYVTDSAADRFTAVNAYSKKGIKLYTITPPTSTSPTSLVINGDGNLYVGYEKTFHPQGGGFVHEYPAGQSWSQHGITLDEGPPTVLAVDALNNLYAAEAIDPNRHEPPIVVFRPNSTKKLRTLPGVYPVAMAFDQQNSLYVADDWTNSITVFAPNSKTVLRTITSDISKPVSLAIDSAGNLYVANIGTNTITVYAPESTSILRTIKHAISSPAAIVIGPG